MPAWVLALLLANAPRCETETIRLDWVRTPDAIACPSGDDVAERIVARLGCSPFGPAATARFEVGVERADPGWRARVARFEFDNGVDVPAAMRVLETEDEHCAVLAQAVALTLAIVAERLPRVAPTKTSSTATVAAPTPPVEPPGAPRMAVASPRAPIVVTSTVPPIYVTPPHGSFEVEALLDSGTFPEPAFGARLTTSLRLGRRYEIGVGALLFPVDRVSLFFFGLAAASLHGCARFEPGRFELAGCARLYGGVMSAFTQPGAEPIDPGTFPWVAASAGGTFTAALVGPIHIRFGAEALVTLVNRVFVVDPDRQVVLDEAPVAFLGSAGIVVRFR